MVSIHNQFMLGSTFRACRLLGFTGVLPRGFTRLVSE
jgi:hypothetical protein